MSHLLRRFVDRDMLMRFHWGLAVGHVYTHRSKCKNASVVWPHARRRTTGNDNATEDGATQPQAQDLRDEGSGSEGDEIVAEELDIDLAGSSDEESGGVEQGRGDIEDEDEANYEDMYGYVDSEGDADSD